MYCGAVNVVGRVVSGEGRDIDVTPDFRVRFISGGMEMGGPRRGFRVEFDVRVPWVIDRDPTY